RLVLHPLEQVAGLALEHAAHRIQRAEPHGLRTAVLEHRDVRGGEPDPFGELADAHLALGEFDVDAHDDRHQMTSSRSRCIAVARRSRTRSTATTRTMAPRTTAIPNSSSCTPGSR